MSLRCPTVLRLLAAALLAMVLGGCSTVEETNRSQLMLPFFSDDVMNELGADAYAEVTKEYRTITGTRQAQMVERVGQKIAKASGRNYQWEFKLLDAPTVLNAFCLPGGKVAVFTGILPLCEDEDGLAVVLGHEVAHATSHHGAESMSQELLAMILIGAVALAVDETKWNDETKSIVVTALGAGAQLFFLLRYSREHESEADEIGLRFAIRAGYDPKAAPLLWERMAAQTDQGLEFLSTHPDPSNRARRLRELIPRLVAEEAARKAQPPAR
jgi:metalloendopeptidase OMA1, mitochondrial